MCGIDIFDSLSKLPVKENDLRYLVNLLIWTIQLHLNLTIKLNIIPDH